MTHDHRLSPESEPVLSAPDVVRPPAELIELLANPRRVDELPPDRIPSLLGDLECLRVRLWGRVAHLPSSGTATSGDMNTTVLLDVPTVAKRLHVPPSHVYELGRRGELPTVKIGPKYVRVRVDDLERYIARHRDGVSDTMRPTSKKRGGL